MQCKSLYSGVYTVHINCKSPPCSPGTIVNEEVVEILTPGEKSGLSGMEYLYPVVCEKYTLDEGAELH